MREIGHARERCSARDWRRNHDNLHKYARLYARDDCDTAAFARFATRGSTQFEEVYLDI